MRRRGAVILLVVVGIVFLYLGLSAQPHRMLQIAAGVIFLVAAVLRAFGPRREPR